MIGFSDKARKTAIAVRRMNNALRQRLVAKHGGVFKDYMPMHILATCKQRGIPLSAVPPAIRPKDVVVRVASHTLEKIPKGNGTSVSLDAIPAPVKRKYTKRAASWSENKAPVNSLTLDALIEHHQKILNMLNELKRLI